MTNPKPQTYRSDSTSKKALLFIQKKEGGSQNDCINKAVRFYAAALRNPALSTFPPHSMPQT